MPEQLWATIKDEVAGELMQEPALGNYLSKRILAHETLSAAISELIALKLATEEIPVQVLKQIVDEALRDDPGILQSITTDLYATRQRDPALMNYHTALLYFKGFQALQSYRISHWLWKQNRKSFALYLQSQISEVFCVDIHPAARIGSGILVDHATGIVIGETCVLDNNISIMQEVTLGGTGKESGDRHPKIRSGVLISAGAKVIGNVVIGEGAKIGAGSVVLKDVEPHTTVAGIPATIVGKPRGAQPALDMNHDLNTED